MKKKKLKEEAQRWRDDAKMLADQYDLLMIEHQKTVDELEERQADLEKIGAELDEKQVELERVTEKLEEKQLELKEKKKTIEDNSEQIKTLTRISSVLLCITTIIVTVWWWNCLMVIDEDSYPSGKKLEENFISAGSKYDDGTYFFNLEGYLEENGFKDFKVDYNDDDYHPYVEVTTYNKYWGLDIRSYLKTDLYEGSSQMEFYHCNKPLLGVRSKDYTATYREEVVYSDSDSDTGEDQRYSSSEYSDSYEYADDRTDDEIADDVADYLADDIADYLANNVDNHMVIDVNSGLSIPYSLLVDLDRVLKAQDYNGSPRIAKEYFVDRCPFQDLDIEHYVEAGFVGGFNPHDD